MNSLLFYIGRGMGRVGIVGAGIGIGTGMGSGIGRTGIVGFV